MKSWPQVPLGELCEVTAGGTPSRAIASNFGGEIPWVKIGDMLQGHVLKTEEHLSHTGLNNSAAKILPAGTVLMSIFATVGRTAILGVDAATNQAIAGITPRDVNKLLPSYLRRFLDSHASALERQARGVAQANINSSLLRAVSVPLPPLPEQRRIAAILDKADTLRSKRRAALAQLDTLRRSIFLDIFGDPATNPKGWPVVSIADIAEVRGGKRLPKGEEYSPVPTPFRYIRVLDLRGGRVDESALVYLKPDVQAEITRYVVNTGDVIISIAGSIGLVAPVPKSLDGVNLTENAAKLSPLSPGYYETDYLASYLQSDYAQGEIRSYVGQVTIGKLALFRIEKIKLPLPPIELQQEFVRRTAAVGVLATAQGEAEVQVDDLFFALQERAFQGRL